MSDISAVVEELVEVRIKKELDRVLNGKMEFDNHPNEMVKLMVNEILAEEVKKREPELRKRLVELVDTMDFHLGLSYNGGLELKMVEKGKEDGVD